MSTISELLIKIGADNSGFTKALGDTKQQISQTFSDVSPLNTMQGALTDTTGKVEALLGSFTKFAAVAAGGFGLTSLISASVEAGESLYQLQHRLGTTTAEAGAFKKIMALTGGDVDTACAAIMRMDKTLSGSGEAAEKANAIFNALGITMHDQEGKLLAPTKQLEQLAEGYKKATTAGYGQEFIMNTLGARGLALTKTLQNYAEAKENASKIQSNGLVDPEEMHKIDQEMKVINMQLGQLKSAGGAALAPIAKEILPEILSGLQGTAKFIKENGTAIKDTTKNVVELIAVYKSLQAARSIALKVGSAVSVATSHKEEITANAAKEDTLTKQQEKAIAQRIRNIEKQALAEEKAYAKSVESMQISEAKKSEMVAKYTVQREQMAAEAAARERAIMTEMFAQINAEQRASAANAATSYGTQAAAAESAAARTVRANAAVSASEAETANAATIAGERKVAAETMAKAAVAETTIAIEAQTVAQTTNGNNAVVQGEKKVGAETMAKAAIAETTLAQEGLTVATVTTGNTAVVQGTRMAEACAVATGAVGRLTSAVWALAMGWWGVFAAVSAVMYLSSQRSTATARAVNSKYITLEDGTQVESDGAGGYKGVYDADAAKAATIGDTVNTGDDYDTGTHDYSSSAYAGEDGESESVYNSTSEPSNNYYELTDAQKQEAWGKDTNRPMSYEEWFNSDDPEAVQERARQEYNKQSEEWSAKMKELMADTGKTMKTSGGGGRASGGGSSAVKEVKPVEYDVPIGEYVAQVAAENFQQGDQWRGTLGNDVDGWCDDFTHEVYKQVFESLGRENPFDGVVNDIDFKNLGAYHSGNVDEIRGSLNPGDMIDTPGHVGIYLGNGMVRSRQSSAGINDLSLDDFSATFGGIIGYGSIAEASGGQTVKSGLLHNAGVTKEAQEAARALANARKEADALMQTMRETVRENEGYDYQNDMLKNAEDVMRKRQQINKIAATPGIEKERVAALTAELDRYAKAIDEKVKKKWKESFDEMTDSAALAQAKVTHNYEAEAEAEYRASIRKLDKEREAKEKSLMRDKDDYKTRAVIADWYYAQVEAAEDNLRKSKEQAHEKYVNWLAEEGAMAKLVAELNSEKGRRAEERSLNISGEKKLAQQYVTLWRTAHGSMTGYIADISSTMYDSLSDSMTDFVKGTKSAKNVLLDFGNSVLNMMAKIAAQRLAASWMTGLLGAFGGGSSGFTLSNGTSLDPSFGYTGSVVSGFKFAKGGIVTAPTMAMIGEAGENEAVIPLNAENLAAIGGKGKGGNVTVNITNNTGSKVDAEQTTAKWDGEQWVVGVVLNAVATNQNGIRSMIKGVAST